jgi:hypothetical protein
MSHESEMNQDICNLDMEKGLHEDKLYLNYPQKFVRAPLSQHPSKSPSSGKSSNPAQIMSETLYAK